MAPPSWREAGVVLVVGWFTLALSVTAAATDKWFIGSYLKAGRAATLSFCSDTGKSTYSLEDRKWCALSKCTEAKKWPSFYLKMLPKRKPSGLLCSQSRMHVVSTR